MPRRLVSQRAAVTRQIHLGGLCVMRNEEKSCHWAWTSPLFVFVSQNCKEQIKQSKAKEAANGLRKTTKICLRRLGSPLRYPACWQALTPKEEEEVFEVLPTTPFSPERAVRPLPCSTHLRRTSMFTIVDSSRQTSTFEASTGCTVASIPSNSAEGGNLSRAFVARAKIVTATVTIQTLILLLDAATLMVNLRKADRQVGFALHGGSMLLAPLE